MLCHGCYSLVNEECRKLEKDDTTQNEDPIDKVSINLLVLFWLLIVFIFLNFNFKIKTF